MKIKVRVKPGSGKSEVIKISDDEYVVYLKSRAEDNKANLELVKSLHKYFKSPVRIDRGIKSRNKIVEIK